MNSTLAKLHVIRKRTEDLQSTHMTIPTESFDNLRDQFFAEAEKLKVLYSDLNDFKPANYQDGKMNALTRGYQRYVCRELISDIDYFLGFVDRMESVQIPNLQVTTEGLFFAGQHFDALLKFSEIIENAKSEVILIDSYVDEKVLNVLTSKTENVACKVLTLEKSISKLIPFIEQFNKQNKNLEVRSSDKFHDRFVIIDQNEFYHFGASIKDAGNKGFMFSKIEQDFIKKGLLNEFNDQWSDKT